MRESEIHLKELAYAVMEAEAVQSMQDVPGWRQGRADVAIQPGVPLGNSF